MTAKPEPDQRHPGKPGPAGSLVVAEDTSKRRSAFWWARRTALVVFGLGLLWLFAVWPPPIWYRWAWPGETAFMALRERQAAELSSHPQRRRESQDGAPLERRYHPVPAEQIDPDLFGAVLVAEDHRFFDHGGIDYQAVREALGYRRQDFSLAEARDREELWRALRDAWSNRSEVRGASTITQQLAKNLYLSPSRNPFRKLKEAITAYRLEWALGKRRILELYVNVVELGPEIWGAEAASQAYFHRSADRLSRDQSAAIAATLPAPLTANPGYRAGRIRWRQQLILRRMSQEGSLVAARLGLSQ